ncbi:MAG: hypothetical protein VB584_00570, partial [Candidatus Nitrosopelagicus sp.]
MVRFGLTTFRLQGLANASKNSNALATFRSHVSSISWEDYHDWLLKNKNSIYANIIFKYSKRYQNLAFSQDMLKVAETRKKADVLKSLANLTRFLDITNDTSFHEEFTRWIKRKEIKWNVRTKDDNYHIAHQIPSSRILSNIRKLPHDYSIFGMFALVSGLRTGE